MKQEEADLIFETVPQVQVQELMLRSSLVNEKLQLPIEKQKAELVRRITALENGNAKQITLENVRRAREAFQRTEGDTGSPEVQGTVFFIAASDKLFSWLSRELELPSQDLNPCFFFSKYLQLPS